MTCWNQQSVSPKQAVGFTCVFNSEIDQLIPKFIVPKCPRADPDVYFDSDAGPVADKHDCSELGIVATFPEMPEMVSSKHRKSKNDLEEDAGARELIAQTSSVIDSLVEQNGIAFFQNRIPRTCYTRF